jgi:hypothetical protein
MFQRKTENLIVKDFLNDDPIADDNYLYSASANDMTGLAPTVAHNEYEAQSYEELFPYLPPTPLTPEGVPATAASDGIHAEYRTEVSRQKQDNKTK